jgi:hypothetical protein
MTGPLADEDDRRITEAVYTGEIGLARGCDGDNCYALNSTQFAKKLVGTYFQLT